MLDLLRRTQELLSRRERGLLSLLLVVSTIGALSEVFGIFSILPFLAAAGNPEIIHTNAILRSVYTYFEFTSDRSFLVACGLVTIAALVTNNAIGCFTLWFRTRVCYRIVQGLAERLFRSYLGQRYIYFLNHNSTALHKNLLNETQNFCDSLLDPATTLAARSLSILFVAIALAIHNWRVAAVVVVTASVVYGGIYLFFRRRLTFWGEQRWESSESIGKLSMEALNGIKDVKLSGFENWFLCRFSIIFARIVTARRKATLYANLPRYLVETIAFSAIVVVVLVILVGNGTLNDILPTLGLYALTGYRLMPAMMNIYGCLSQIRYGGPAVENLRTVIREANDGTLPIVEDTVREKLRFATSVDFHDISYSYPGSSRPVLKGVTFSIPAFSCVGFVGASGAGKSTLMDIALGMLQPSGGVIKVDGVALTPANLRSWQNNLGYVAQQIYLSDASIRENIAFGVVADAIDHERVERAARLACLHDFISSQLPKGYDTLVGERGARLSGGQRQRIGIARALYNDPEILFFDEATSALDNETEEAIVESIQSIAHRKTVIMIAHRLTSLRHCDTIFVLEAGLIARASTYRELIASGIPGLDADKASPPSASGAHQ